MHMVSDSSSINREFALAKEIKAGARYMSQSHLTIDFPIKGPANAKALTEDLPPLMPDFARTQDQLGTVHFSRFMVRGDEKLLFLSDIDGEVDTHIERLVERAGPVFDAIFTHVDNPPATPVASNPQKVIQWLKRHVREPLDMYFAYRGRVGSRHQGVRSCGGLYGQYPAGALLTYMAFKSRLRGFVLKLVGKAVVGEKGHRASDAIGTLHVAHFVPFEKNHLGFFTIFDGDFAKYHPGLRRQERAHFRHALSTCRWRAANPGRQERPGVLSVGTGQQPSAHRVLQRVSRPLGSRHSSPAGRSQVTAGHRSIAVVERRTIRVPRWQSRTTQGETL